MGKIVEVHKLLKGVNTDIEKKSMQHSPKERKK